MLLLLITGALLVTGCGSTQGGQARPGEGATPTGASSAGEPPTTEVTTPATTTPGPTTPPAAAAPPPNPTGGQADVPASLLDMVRADAAQRAGVAPSQVRIVSSTPQTWGDGSLGCPKPGEAYIQVMVEGFQIFAEAGGHTYDYRTSQTGIRLCEK
jgi:hypothetical protein